MLRRRKRLFAGIEAVQMVKSGTIVAFDSAEGPSNRDSRARVVKPADSYSDCR